LLNRLCGADLAGNRGTERNEHQKQQELLHDDLLGGLVSAAYRRGDTPAHIARGPAGITTHMKAHSSEPLDRGRDLGVRSRFVAPATAGGALRQPSRALRR